MADIFQDGDEGSRGKFVAALESLQTTGQSVLDDLAQTRTSTLLRFEQGLGALNSRRQRAFRLPSPDVAARFVVSDLLDVDQTTTSATLRADSQAVSLRERNRPASPSIQSQQFSSATGTVEQFNGMYRVTADTAPTGIFNLVFATPTDLTLVVFDIVMTPSNPKVTVQTSLNGVVFTDALGVSMSGYRVTAWLPAGKVKYLRLQITPNHPDTLGGRSYTFGLTSFNAFMVEFQLASEMTTLPVPVMPLSRMLRFVAEETPGVLYFLALGEGAPFVGVVPGQLIAVPLADPAVVGDDAASLDGTGRLSWTGNPTGHVPDSVYQQSLTIAEGPAQMSLAPGLDPAAAARLTVPVFCWHDSGLYLRPFSSADQARRFSVAYMSGPATLTARLRVQLTSRDRAQTPVFNGATLENA